MVTVNQANHMKLRGDFTLLDSTVAEYRKAITYLIPIVNDNWADLLPLMNLKRQQMVERWIHETKENTPTYDFDKKFKHFPSYLRRAAITDAIGVVSSYRSNWQNWKDAGCKGHEPKLALKHYKTPSFYKNNMFKAFDAVNHSILLKVYDGSDWRFETYYLKTSDCTYYQRYLAYKEQQSPTIVKKGRKYVLVFTYETKVPLVENPDLICAVDLGLNTDATCSIITKNGTVLDRKFITISEEKARLTTATNRIKRNQRRGNKENKRLWTTVKGLTRSIAEKTVLEILDFGLNHGAQVFVFEYLDFKKGPLSKRIHYWQYKRIYQIMMGKAHLYGCRVARVNARNTSRLAYDGTGETLRGNEIGEGTPYALLQFTTGKTYNADLNASYNIGARYWIREILKPLPKKVRSACEAEVPHVSRRTTCTLADLWALSKVTIIG